LTEYSKKIFGTGLRCIDVAGGNGELTRALINPKIGCAIESIVVDPRKDT
jgi:ubiquinone/menaquinone biosynthesis C-methylase UbiE